MKQYTDSIPKPCHPSIEGGATAFAVVFANLSDLLDMRNNLLAYAATLLLALCALPASAQEEDPPCFAAEDCSNLRLLILRDPAGACPGSSGTCLGADPFSRTIYRVYLRYAVDDSTPDSLLTFALAHQSLNARVVLDRYNGQSQIDLAATKACFLAGPGAAWDLADKVVFDDRVPGEIALDFLNADSLPDCGASDARIMFDLDAPANAETCPSGKKCAYAYLFPVVVRTVPGDTVLLKCASLDYDPPAGGSLTPCTLTSCAVNTNNNGQNGIFPYTVPQAPTPTGDNADLLVQLTGAWDSPDVDNAEVVAVQITNSGAGSVDVDYLEFTLKVSVGVSIPDILFAAPFGPPLSVKKVTVGSGFEYHLWYALDFSTPLTLSPSTTVSLDTLTIGPPMPFNQYWEGEVVLTDENKSRVRTEEECSRLELSGTVVVLESTGGTPPCDSTLIPKEVRFAVRAVEDTTGACLPPKLLIGFYAEGNPGPIELVFETFGCVIDLDLGGSLSISGVNFVNGWTCNGSCPDGCFAVGLTDDSELSITLCNQSSLLLDETHTNYEAFFEVEFEGVGCINAASLVGLYYHKDPNADFPCVPRYDNSYLGIPACGGQATGHIAFWKDDLPMENAKVYLDAVHSGSGCDSTSCPRDSMLTNVDGEYVLCPCVECDSFVVTPYRNDYHLNGVSTFDLVLINRHVLGIEPLNSPYKMIAADVNGSNSITTLDIVELRKLILGIYTDLPNVTSWRFVNAGYSFPNPANPFQTIFPETAIVPPSVNDFVAIKVGDVNGNAAPRPESERPSLTIAWPLAESAKNGKTFTVPIVYTGSEPLQALQMGLWFDPAVLALVGPSKGELPAVSQQSFGLTRADQGEIRMLWLPDGAEPDQFVLPGTTLFYLTFDLLAPLPEGGLPLRTDDEVLACLAWSPEDTEHALRGADTSEAARPAGPLSGTITPARPDAPRAVCRPNPTASDALLAVHAPKDGQGRVALFDAFGKLVFMRKVELVTGGQDVPMPEAAGIPPGVYVWKVFASGQKAVGHLVKH